MSNEKLKEVIHKSLDNQFERLTEINAKIETIKNAIAEKSDKNDRK